MDDSRNMGNVVPGGENTGGTGAEGHVFCTQCGAENKAGLRFCVKCGHELVPVSQPSPYAGEVTPMPKPPSAGGMMPEMAVTVPAQAPRTVFRVKRTVASSAGATAVMLAGILVLISTWLAWGKGPGGSLSGWGWYNVGRLAVSRGGNVANPLFVYFEGYPVFTGLCSLLLGLMMAISGFFLLIFASRKVAITAIFVASLALGMAVINLSSILRQPETSIGAGLIIFALFAAVGLGGGIIGLRGSSKPDVSMEGVKPSAPASVHDGTKVEAPLV